MQPHYAILQKDLAIPSIEKLKQAFRNVPFLTDMDAFTLAGDAFGILVKRLNGENAAALQGALARVGIETEIVPERQLPPLPPTKFVHRFDCEPDGLKIYDPLGRHFLLEWGHIMLIAAGDVRLNEFKQIRKTREVTRYSGEGYGQTETIVETSSREERNYHLSLELVLTRAVQRFSAVGERLNFSYLGDRQTNDHTYNFTLLVQDLIQRAPRAVINRGAYYFRENAEQVFSYPSKNAFFEEITWLLWQRAQEQKNGSGS